LSNMGRDSPAEASPLGPEDNPCPRPTGTDTEKYPLPGMAGKRAESYFSVVSAFSLSAAAKDTK